MARSQFTHTAFGNVSYDKFRLYIEKGKDVLSEKQSRMLAGSYTFDSFVHCLNALLLPHKKSDEECVFDAWCWNYIQWRDNPLDRSDRPVFSDDARRNTSAASAYEDLNGNEAKNIQTLTNNLRLVISLVQKDLLRLPSH